jgi:hypothetical protein
MTGPRTSEMDILLTSQDAERIRGVLAACSKLLAWAERYGDREFQGALHDAVVTAHGSGPPGHLRYDINLCIDYIDFAHRIRSKR